MAIILDIYVFVISQNNKGNYTYFFIMPYVDREVQPNQVDLDLSRGIQERHGYVGGEALLASPMAVLETGFLPTHLREFRRKFA